MQRCLIYLKKLFFSNPYRKSIWFFIILWVLTFLGYRTKSVAILVPKIGK